MNKPQRASETQPKNKLNKTTKTIASRKRGFTQNFITLRNGGLSAMKFTIESLKAYLSDPHRQPSARVVEFYNSAVAQYDLALRNSIGMPTYSNSVTLQSEAPKDIPTLPLDGYQLVSRTCLVEKLASGGTTAGGFYATLVGTDLAPFTKNQFFRLKAVTSWTGTTYGSVGSSFAGVQVPAGVASDGTEVMPIWSENWTPVGQGFAGIRTTYPLGDYPQIGNTSAAIFLTHFTSLGGTGGVAGVPVIFHVEIECLV